MISRDKATKAIASLSAQKVKKEAPNYEGFV